MNARHTGSTLALAALVGVAVATSAASQKPTNAQPGATPSWTQAKTPWGDPDLQGVWRYEAAIPLERPARFEGRESLTDDEIKESQRLENEQEAQRLAGAEGAAVGRQSVTARRFAGTSTTVSGRTTDGRGRFTDRPRWSSIPKTAACRTHPTPGKRRHEPVRAMVPGRTSRTSIPIPANVVSPTVSPP